MQNKIKQYLRCAYLLYFSFQFFFLPSPPPYVEHILYIPRPPISLLSLYLSINQLYFGEVFCRKRVICRPLLTLPFLPIHLSTFLTDFPLLLPHKPATRLAFRADMCGSTLLYIHQYQPVGKTAQSPIIYRKKSSTTRIAS